jgi:hypothetical protein
VDANKNCNIRLPDDFSISIITTQEEYLALIQSGFDFSGYPKNEDIDFALGKGAYLICVFKEKTLAHTTWLAFNGKQSVYDSLFYANRIGRHDDAFIGPCNTYTPFRGLGLYPAVLTVACDYLKKKNMRSALINTKKSNYPSMRGIEKAGFGMVKVAHVIYIFGQKMIFFRCLNRGEC